MTSKLTTAEFIEKAIKIHEEKFDYSKVEYINSVTPVIITCKIHGDYKQKPWKHLSSKGCKLCVFYNASIRNRKDKDTFIEEANTVHNHKYDYSQIEYINEKQKMNIICSLHGLFKQSANPHLRGQGCPICGKEKQIKSNTKDIEWFIENAKAKHNDRYDYSKSIYIGMKFKIEIICHKHGSFWQLVNNHLRGKGCKKCFIESQTGNLQDFIARSNIIHHNKFDYSKSIYTDSITKLEIICPIHGSFFQTPDAHSRCGCFQCGRDLTGRSVANDLEYFIRQSNIVHHNKYDYSKTEYTIARNMITIICPIHGEFRQLAMSHLAGKGCRKCTKSISKLETKWLDQLGISNANRNQSLKIANTWIKPDGFDPTTNTIYEFYGDFWHGNPQIYNQDAINGTNHKTYGELYKNTINREKLIKDAGYNLVTIWENEWDKQARNYKCNI
jgi:hypothetical protein